MLLIFISVIIALFLCISIIARSIGSVQFTHKGIKIRCNVDFYSQERVQIKMGIDYIQEKLENKLSLSRVCIIEEAFKDLTVILVTDRTSKIRYAIVKLFFKKAFVVDFTNGIMRSSLVKGVGDVILTHCSCLTESMKKKILSLVDKGKRR